MTARKQNNRGRIGKASTRGAANGISIRGASSRTVSSTRARPPLGPRTRARELLPDFNKGRVPPPREQCLETSGPANHPREIQSLPAHPVQPEAAVEEPPPKVGRIYNGIWESGPASLAFATHGNLDHSEDTIILALNILDHIIRPENWNPALSNNKLSASCFFFASKLTGKRVTATQVAESIWIHPSMVAEMSQANEGTLFDRILKSLAVSAEQVVQGYEILYEQRESLRDLLGEYGEELANLPLPATEMELILLDSEEESSQVAIEMIKMGYQRGSGLRKDGRVFADLGEMQDGEVDEDWNNDFEDFVAENE